VVDRGLAVLVEVVAFEFEVADFFGRGTIYLGDDGPGLD
jgi:hypothetical protein